MGLLFGNFTNLNLAFAFILPDEIEKPQPIGFDSVQAYISGEVLFTREQVHDHGFAKNL